MTSKLSQFSKLLIDPSLEDAAEEFKDYFLDRSNQTGTQTADTISDFEQAIASYLWSGAELELRVGNDEQYENVSDAINAAMVSNAGKPNGVGINIILSSGYIWDEQIVFPAGIDMSNIRITSEDLVVYCDTSTFTDSVRVYYEHIYMFHVAPKSVSPVISVQFENKNPGSMVCAFVVDSLSTLLLEPYSGARAFNVGIHAAFGAKVFGLHTGSAPDATALVNHKPAGYYLCDFTQSEFQSIQIMCGSFAHMPVSKFDDCQSGNQPSVFVIYNSEAYLQGSSSRNNYIGWVIRDGSRVNIRDHQTTNCTYTGLRCIHNAYVDARRHDTEESDPSTSGQVLSSGDQNGFYGCALGVRLDGTGSIDLAGNDMRNCGTCVEGATGASISGKAVDISDSTLGFRGDTGASFSFPRLWAKNVGQLCDLDSGSKLTSWTSHSSYNTSIPQSRFISLEAGSEFHATDNDIDADTGIFCGTGSRMSLTDCTIKVQAVRSYYGGDSTLYNIDFDKTYNLASGLSQLMITGGGIIRANSITNSDASSTTANVTVNTLVANGIVFLS